MWVRLGSPPLDKPLGRRRRGDVPAAALGPRLLHHARRQPRARLLLLLLLWPKDLISGVLARGISGVPSIFASCRRRRRHEAPEPPAGQAGVPRARPKRVDVPSAAGARRAHHQPAPLVEQVALVRLAIAAPAMALLLAAALRLRLVLCAPTAAAARRGLALLMIRRARRRQRRRLLEQIGPKVARHLSHTHTRRSDLRGDLRGDPRGALCMHRMH